MISGQNTMTEELSETQKQKTMVTARMIVGALREGLGDGYDLSDALIVMANVTTGLLGAACEAEYVRTAAYCFISDFSGRVNAIYDLKIAQKQAKQFNVN